MSTEGNVMFKGSSPIFVGEEGFEESMGLGVKCLLSYYLNQDHMHPFSLSVIAGDIDPLLDNDNFSR